MTRLLTKLEKLARIFYYQKRKFQDFIGSAPLKEDFSCSWICNVAFESDTEKVLDHCHSTGKFFGYAHNECNPKRRTINYTPIIAHNMMDYDLHHIVKAIHIASGTTKFDVIAIKDEKFIALNFCIFTEKRKRKRGEVTVREYLRFIDRFIFMPCSLENPVKTLPENKFSLLDSFFCGYTENQRTLLKKKKFPIFLC